MRLFLTALAACLPLSAFAAGGNDSTPPTQTETTTVCEEGFIFDQETQTCIEASESSFNDTERLDAIRELAHAGKLDAALVVLASLEDQTSDLALTYAGFINRKLGNLDAAMGYYSAALAQNPNNVLARSYKGQAHLEAGELTLARAELTEIRLRGGRGTWAEISLRMAIESGAGFSY